MKKLACILLLLLAVPAAFADGGVVLLQQNAGPFTITLFSTRPRLEVGDADLSVMVEDRRTGDVLLDPVINFELTGQDGDGIPTVLHLSHDQASNRLLQATTLHFPRPGQWDLTVAVQRGDAAARVSNMVRVEPGRSRTMLVRFYLLLPIAIILLFVIHQRLKIGHKQDTALLA